MSKTTEKRANFVTTNESRRIPIYITTNNRNYA